MHAQTHRHAAAPALPATPRALRSPQVLGNPRGLFNRMATGVTDAFYEPMQGIMRGPEEFAEGVIRGGRSLGSNVLYGVTDSISKMTGSLAKGVAELSMDKEYLEKRRAMTSASNAADVPRSVGQGLSKAAEGVAGGLARGVFGMVSKPFKGAEREGVEGFFKGLGAGAGVSVFLSGRFKILLKLRHFLDHFVMFLLKFRHFLYHLPGGITLLNCG